MYKEITDGPIWNQPAIYLKVYIYLESTSDREFDNIMDAVNESDSLSKKKLKDIIKWIDDNMYKQQALEIIIPKKESKYASEQEFYYQDEDLNRAAIKFIKHRRDKGKPITKYGMKLAINKLNNYSKGDKDLMLTFYYQTLTEGWDGFHPLKPEYQEKYKKQLELKNAQVISKNKEITDEDRERARRLING